MARVALGGIDETAVDALRLAVFGLPAAGDWAPSEAPGEFGTVLSSSGEARRVEIVRLDENIRRDLDVILIARSSAKNHDQAVFARYLGALLHTALPTSVLIFVDISEPDECEFDAGEWAKIQAMFSKHPHLKQPYLLPPGDAASAALLRDDVFHYCAPRDEGPVALGILDMFCPLPWCPVR